MKRLLLLFTSFFFSGSIIYSQCVTAADLNQNDLTTTTLNNGQVFWQLNNTNLTNNLSIFSAGLWIGGFQSSGALKLAAVTYSTANSQDFWPGPLDENTAQPIDSNCENYNRFWQVFGYEIEQHIQDFNDNGIIDNPIENIFGYPAHGNNSFEALNGFTLR